MERHAITDAAGNLPASPYSPGLAVDRFVFISGQIGTDPHSGALAGPGMAAQTRQALENLRAVLEQAGFGLQHVVKTTVFLTRIEDFQEMNAVYRGFFAEPLPARSTVGVAALARPDLVVEIEGIALR